ncbi:MAG: hypothetical protein IT509_08430 [Rhodocyclaceae bacterium]|nr:hypothetical protein [Rhodocyclaceae bacterium]
MTAPDAPPSAVVTPSTPRTVAEALRGHAAMISSGGFTAGQDEPWFAASINRLAERAAATEAALGEAVKALRECAADLEAHLDREYPAPDRLTYPDQRRKYERDSAPVLKARALLAKIEGRNG